MKQIVFLNLMLICAVIPALAMAQAAEPPARSFVLLLHHGEFQKAVSLLDKNMRKAVSSKQLRWIWNSQLKQTGAFQKIQGTRSEAVGNYSVVFVTCQFEQQQLDVKLVLDKAKRIAGLFFVPTQSTSYQPASYVKKDSFKEVEVQVGRWALPGTLSMPNGKGPFPAMVLVHGSGPQDRDETVGPNKPFRDLAWGLSSRGMAVLRYEKRTKQHVEQCAALRDFTVQEETVEDALAAVLLLQERRNINPDRVFVLGHSLGGMMIPRIASGRARIAGFILMAAPARPLEDLMLEQTLYQASLVPELPADAQARIDALRKQVSAVKALDKTDVSAMPLLNAPPSYWLDLRDYRPAEDARNILQPMLILQGKKDCQVSITKDFQVWHRALSEREDVQFRSYLELNHLFMKTEGKSTGAEYHQPGNVDATVVNDIANWVSRRN